MWQQLEAKAAKFCSKFPQHLFSVTFKLSQPCYVSPFINVYEVVAITTAIKQTKIANECLSFSICLYCPLNPPIRPYSLPTPSVSQVVTTPREWGSAACYCTPPPPPWWAPVSTLLPRMLPDEALLVLPYLPFLSLLMPHFLAFWLFWPRYLCSISLSEIPRASPT